jgi:hypothetical protein
MTSGAGSDLYPPPMIIALTCGKDAFRKPPKTSRRQIWSRLLLHSFPLARPSANRWIGQFQVAQPTDSLTVGARRVVSPKKQNVLGHPVGDSSPLAEADQRTFTSAKLDWMTALSADPRLDARAFEVGFCIAQHVNAESGRAIVSDDTISDKTGIPKRWVLRARVSLKEARWIDWQRTRSANIYWTLADSISAVTDHQIILKEMRTERQSKARKARQETPPLAYLKYRKTQPVALPETPPVGLPEMPPVANIHLSSYTLSLTPSKVAKPSV